MTSVDFESTERMSLLGLILMGCGRNELWQAFGAAIVILATILNVIKILEARKPKDILKDEAYKQGKL